MLAGLQGLTPRQIHDRAYHRAYSNNEHRRRRAIRQAKAALDAGVDPLQVLDDLCTALW